MKGKFVFLSDFDGTLSEKDFYQIVIDRYMGEEGRVLLREWKKDKYLDRNFLALIYRSMNRTEAEILEDILSIPLDETAIPFIERVRENGGEFVILSAGTSYYIERLLEARGMGDIQVYSNPGIYKDGGIHMQPDKESPYYSEMYGIDKGKILLNYKKQYDKVFFAGDSRPDIAPSKLADVVFAKGSLQNMLRKEGIGFVGVESFQDIENYLRKNHILK